MLNRHIGNMSSSRQIFMDNFPAPFFFLFKTFLHHAIPPSACPKAPKSMCLVVWSTRLGIRRTGVRSGLCDVLSSTQPVKYTWSLGFPLREVKRLVCSPPPGAVCLLNERTPRQCRRWVSTQWTLRRCRHHPPPMATAPILLPASPSRKSLRPSPSPTLQRK